MSRHITGSRVVSRPEAALIVTEFELSQETRAGLTVPAEAWRNLLRPRAPSVWARIRRWISR